MNSQNLVRFTFSSSIQFFLAFIVMKLPQLAKFVEQTIEITPRIVEYQLSPERKTILDFGYPKSKTGIELVSLGHSVCGVDSRSSPFKHSNFDIMKANMTNLYFMVGSFDKILALSVIEHVGFRFYGNPFSHGRREKKPMIQLERVLKPHGNIPFSNTSVIASHFSMI